MADTQFEGPRLQACCFCQLRKSIQGVVSWLLRGLSCLLSLVGSEIDLFVSKYMGAKGPKFWLLVVTEIDLAVHREALAI